MFQKIFLNEKGIYNCDAKVIDTTHAAGACETPGN